ncbi:MAG: AraC family transcriptional regulator [Parvularculaceae bacterium]|nr:AraC family transcriptional regulator [Parvularculaceae bacterium]
MTIAGEERTNRGRRAAAERKSAGPSVAAGVANALFAYALSRGASAATLAKEAGLDLTLLDDADNRVPLSVYLALLRTSGRVTGDPGFALRFGAATNIMEMSVVGLIGAASATVRDALVQINRYARLIAEFEMPPGLERFSLQRAEEFVVLIDNRAYANQSPEVTESVFARMAAGVRRLGDRQYLNSVEVTHAAPAHSALYPEIFGAPVAFGAARNALLLDAAWLDAPIAREPRFVFGILAAHADAQLEALDRSRSLAARVEVLLLPVLHTGEASVAYVARSIGVSRQTLYRRLKGERTSFELVLDALRRRLAFDYLGACKVSVNETAYLLGFSDPAAFSRAFKRWTGVSPKAWRLASR